MLSYIRSSPLRRNTTLSFGSLRSRSMLICQQRCMPIARILAPASCWRLAHTQVEIFGSSILPKVPPLICRSGLSPTGDFRTRACHTQEKECPLSFSLMRQRCPTMPAVPLQMQPSQGSQCHHRRSHKFLPCMILHTSTKACSQRQTLSG